MAEAVSDRVTFWPGNPLSYTTTKIATFREDLPLSSASGFVVQLGTMWALITNWHVVSGFNPSSGQSLSATGSLPDRLECHVAVSTTWDEGGRHAEQLEFRPLSISLFDGDDPVWIDERSGDLQNDYVAIDLVNYVPELEFGKAALRAITIGRITPKKDRSFVEHGPYATDDFQSFYPGVGTEVFVLGYPRGVGSNGIFPIWKRASVASEPQVPTILNGVAYDNAFFIDSLTKSGLSGAPVVCLAKPGDEMYAEDGTPIPIEKAESFVVGVYAGREGVTQEEYELSLGRVWKIGAIERMIMNSAARYAPHSDRPA